MSTENQMNVGGGYEQAASKAENQDMGGGAGAHGSGTAGGWGGAADSQGGVSQQSGQTGQTGEKQDWLDKGIEFAGKKAGVNVSDANADKAGDFANKEFNQYEGRGLPGVQ